jgi:tRNA 5-methylaminomethyl-2-thiouridine biosynthesis bifunctional protein
VYVRLQPARVVVDAGVPFSPDYGDVYASRDGAPGQARHVFLGGNGLPARWQRREQFVVLETGFGLGTNFLATWLAWRRDPQRPQRLHFVSVEKHPVDAATLAALAPPELHALARELADQLPPLLPGLHRVILDDDRVTLTLAFGDAPELLPQLVLGADAVYLDGFAPDRNPRMWEPALLKAIGRIARPGATLATWCTARAVRDGLSAAGFDVELRAGFSHKRQMLAARFAPRWRVRRTEPPAPYAGERSALVVGGGLAGATCADALARRGWRVTVLDRAAEAPGGASALPWGIAHPQLTADDSAAARLTRAGFFETMRLLHRLPVTRADGRDGLWETPGLLQVARDDVEAGHWRRMVDAVAPPDGFAQYVDAAAGTQLAGVAVKHGGLWFPGGAVIAAAALCRRLLGHERIDLRRGAGVHDLKRVAPAPLSQAATGTPPAGLAAGRPAPPAGGWRAVAAAGETLAVAPVAVVAAALDSPRLLRLAHAPVAAVRGRLSLLDAAALPSLRAALGGAGYLVPAPGAHGGLSLGATYEVSLPGTDSPLSTAQARAANRAGMARLIEAPPACVDIGEFDAERCVARDRLPLAGQVADEALAAAGAAGLRGAHLRDLPRVDGLYASFALGSRGLTVAPLAAEWLAALIEGEPWPIERDLAARFDAGRFLLDALRHGRLG